jgi:hypothetical protein
MSPPSGETRNRFKPLVSTSPVLFRYEAYIRPQYEIAHALLRAGVGNGSQQREAATFTVDGILARGNVTLRPLPVRHSQTEKPISFKPSSSPSMTCSSASASLPGGLIVRRDSDDDAHNVTSRKAGAASGERGRVSAIHVCTSPAVGACRRCHSHCCSVLSPTRIGSAGSSRC